MKKFKKYYTSGAVAGMMGGVTEIFQPSAYEAALIQEAAKEIPAPAPDADKDNPIYSGKIVIQL